MLPSSDETEFNSGSVIIDGTCPGPHWAANYSEWREGGASACVVTAAAGTDSCRSAIAEIASIYRLVRGHGAELAIVTTTGQLEAAKDRGQLGVILQFQGTGPLEYDVCLAETFYRMGVRIIQLAYNQRCPVGDGCLEPGNGGLSTFGRRVVAELNRLGMVVDLSHTGVRTSMEALEVSTQPCIVSHANAAAVHPSPRNLPNELIRAVAAQGGVIGINGFPSFVASAHSPTLPDLTKHAAYISELVGPEHVSLGLDYFSASRSQYDQYIDEGRWTTDSYPPPPWNYPVGIETPATLPNLADALLNAGFSKPEADGVMGLNLMRVFNSIWQNGE